MSKCVVEGCSPDATSWVGPRDEYGFCEYHRVAWAWFCLGYYRGQGYGVDGLLRRKVWYAAMKEFLEACCTEISALTQIAEAIKLER